MNYSFKAKCAGCAALNHVNNTYSCDFGITLHVEEIAGNRVSPSPDNEKCYKPKSSQELREAKKLIKAKEAKVNA